MLHPYFDKNVLLATMHNKEEAIKDTFEEKIGCKIQVPNNFNTDQFGTFSGEIERKHSAYETLKLKAINAADIFGYDYVISSEGSFGPHPNYFVTVDTEMLLFYDKLQQLFIADYEISSETNFSNFNLNKENFRSDAYIKWLDLIKFPSHGIILHVNKNEIYKGIISKHILEDTISSLLSRHDELVLETDMRAMMNPTRMVLIKKLADQLANRVSVLCKNCQTPGFGVIKYSGNLLCKLCHSETRIPRYKNLCCIKCDYKISEIFDPSKEFADPRYCDLCNP